MLEHAGSEALEVYGGPARLAEVEARRSPPACGRGERGRASRSSHRRADGFRLEGERRPANLEDVFVLLTGEEIGDERRRAGAPPAAAGALGADGRARARGRELLVVLASTTFSSTVEPTIYLIAFGFGFGSLVSTIGGYDYVDFVGTGTVATAVLFSSAFPAMFGTFVKYQFQRTYDAILAAPVDTEELVTAEALWIATRAGVYGCVPMLVAIASGSTRRGGCSLVPFIGWIAGFGWANFGISIAGYSKSFENFNYVISAVLTPLFLLAGSFFPLDGFPSGRGARRVQSALSLRPARPDAVFGYSSVGDVCPSAVLVGFGLLVWRVAIRAMTGS